MRDDDLLALDSHRGIEVRLFNPITTRTARMLGTVFEFGRINRRMHNKAFIADNRVAIVGGRNIGYEYFDAHGRVIFADFDVAAVGPVVGEVSQSFDRYWNCRSSIGITDLTRKRATPETAAGVRAGGGKVLMPGLIDAHVHTMMESISLMKGLTSDIGYVNLVAAGAAENSFSGDSPACGIWVGRLQPEAGDRRGACCRFAHLSERRDDFGDGWPW